MPPRTVYVKPTKPLTPEAVAVLMICAATDTVLTQVQIEAALGPSGQRVSIADAADFLESVGFIERQQPPPKTARFMITDQGAAAIERHKARAIRDLKAKIARMQQPHPRDRSIMAEEIVAPYQRLLASLESGHFGKIPRSSDDEEDPGPVHVSRALETAKRQRDEDAPNPKKIAPRGPAAKETADEQADEGEDPELSELEEPPPAPRKRQQRRRRIAA